MDETKKWDSKKEKQDSMLACDICILLRCKQGLSVVQFDGKR